MKFKNLLKLSPFKLSVRPGNNKKILIRPETKKIYTIGLKNKIKILPKKFFFISDIYQIWMFFFGLYRRKKKCPVFAEKKARLLKIPYKVTLLFKVFN